MDSKKDLLPEEKAFQMETLINKSDKISVHHLQIVDRSDLTILKSGEENKKKSYRALCILNKPVTVEILEKLDIPEGFLIQQLTPLRVLHRRPLHLRPRQIYSLKAYANKNNEKQLILDFVTQAGTYIKELVHGDFQRTTPSISGMINDFIE
jgi:tRNA pseudouridine synthase 10